MSNEYKFQTRWFFPEATAEEITAILQDPLELPRWWPAVYLKVTEHQGVYSLHTRGWLPYTLRWSFRVTRSDPPRGFSLEAWGDLQGRGEWSFWPTSGGVEVVYDWIVDANKPLLKFLSPVLRPLFEANHRWAMEQGFISLKRELSRRNRRAAPPPPRPVPWSLIWLSILILVLWYSARYLRI